MPGYEGKDTWGEEPLAALIRNRMRQLNASA